MEFFERPASDATPPVEVGPVHRASGRPSGRPYGTKAAIQAPHRTLRHTHFAYVRYVANGLPLREAWLRCLAFSGGVDDERHFKRRLREVSALIRAGAASRGLATLADAALQGMQLRRQRNRVDPRLVPSESTAAGIAKSEPVSVRTAAHSGTLGSPAAGSAALPSLDEWVALRCAALGIDVDFQSQADWLVEYQEAFELDLVARSQDAAVSLAVGSAGRAVDGLDVTATRVVSLARSAFAAPLEEAAAAGDSDGANASALQRAAALRAQLAALSTLSTLLAVPPTLDDALDTWLAPALCASLSDAGVTSLQVLADYIDRHGHRWWRRVPGVGADRARRLIAWLAPVAEQLGRPLAATAIQPTHQLELARTGQVAQPNPARQKHYGIVPLQRLAVPSELSGSSGIFRSIGPNTFGADDDLAALQAWLTRYATSPQTYRAYFRAVELFYLWCLWERRIALSSLAGQDLQAFRTFMLAPTPQWIQARAVSRDSADWRPLRGPVTERSQRLLFAAVRSLFAGLVGAGYLTANPFEYLKLHWTQPVPRLGVQRALSEAEWTWVLATLAERPDTSERRRLQLVLELATSTGLRLTEMAGARRGQLRQEWLEGQTGPPTWFLEVFGKSRRRRDVVIEARVKELIDRHQTDQIGAEKAARRAAVTREGPVSSAPIVTDEATHAGDAHVAPLAADDPRRPLIAALRQPPPRWTLGADGQPEKTLKAADEQGALEASALYQGLKRLFERAAQRAHLADPPLDGAVLRRASTHWLRHTFANQALDRGVDLAVVRDVLGHADLATTSIYLRTEQRTMARKMAKPRRPR